MAGSRATWQDPGLHGRILGYMAGSWATWQDPGLHGRILGYMAGPGIHGRILGSRHQRTPGLLRWQLILLQLLQLLSALSPTCHPCAAAATAVTTVAAAALPCHLASALFAAPPCQRYWPPSCSGCFQGCSQAPARGPGQAARVTPCPWVQVCPARQAWGSQQQAGEGASVRGNLPRLPRRMERPGSTPTCNHTPGIPPPCKPGS